MTRDARLSALHRGGFGLPGPRFSVTEHPPPLTLRQASGTLSASSSQPGRSAWRAGSLPPGAAVASRRRRTPLPAPPSGCLRRRPSKSEDASLVASIRNVVNSVVVAWLQSAGEHARLLASCLRSVARPWNAARHPDQILSAADADVFSLRSQIDGCRRAVYAVALMNASSNRVAVGFRVAPHPRSV